MLRLEKEARELEKTAEALRQSQAKSAELEKTNKKLYSQTHTDRKEIIKLREVTHTVFSRKHIYSILKVFRVIGLHYYVWIILDRTLRGSSIL